MNLKRTLEEEVMDTVEEAIAYDSMDHQAVNTLFVDDLLTAAGQQGIDLEAESPEILDLGTGTGLIPIELCRRGPSFRVLAVDAAASMLDLARNHIEIANLGMQIRLDRVDAKRLEYPDGRFDVVMSNSIIHHLPEPGAALREAVRVARCGGLLFFRDLMRPETSGQLDTLVDLHAGDESEHGRQMFRDSLHAALNLDEIREMVSAAGFATDSVNATSDRHWTWVAVKPH